ncbi:aquaporin AQPAe.a-like isoform X3 [Bradysia coprophila]|nr:aquaporin AQPAe.a-like isoform X3 [Bradysia coprophila]
MKSTLLDTVSMFLAELNGVGFILFFGCMGCLNGAPHLQIALNFGIAVMTSVQIFGFISGAHFNPAVTVAALIYKKISVPMACIYFMAQMMGGFMGFGLLKLVIPTDTFSPANETNGPGLCTTIPRYDVTDFQALTIEFVATAVLILVCCAVWDERNSHLHDSVALRFGFVIFMLACSAGPFTGASMNPARSFAPALWNTHFDKHWIYWLAPMSAGVITTYIYRAVFWRPKVEDEHIANEEYALKDNTIS